MPVIADQTDEAGIAKQREPVFTRKIHVEKDGVDHIGCEPLSCRRNIDRIGAEGGSSGLNARLVLMLD